MNNTSLFRPILENLRKVPNLLIITLPTMMLGVYACVTLVTEFDWQNLLYFIMGYIVINIISY